MGLGPYFAMSRTAKFTVNLTENIRLELDVRDNSELLRVMSLSCDQERARQVPIYIPSPNFKLVRDRRKDGGTIVDTLGRISYRRWLRVRWRARISDWALYLDLISSPYVWEDPHTRYGRTVLSSRYIRKFMYRLGRLPSVCKFNITKSK